MAQINIADMVQERLNLPPLQKINPNTQEVKKETFETGIDKLAQASIPAVLAGIYMLSTYDEGVEAILRGNKSTKWVDTLFKGKAGEAIQRVATYSGASAETAANTMERAAAEAVRIIHEHVSVEKEEQHHNKLNEFLTTQRDKILVYLPGALQMGQLLKDDTLDDRTNKMEGPVSGFMHRVEKVFSSGTKDVEKGLF